MLAYRSDLVRACRRYFESEGLHEVTTPLLREYGANEVHLDSVRTSGGSSLYLQTSPEYAMKILLAKYGASLFQICPAVRGGEKGPRHRIEFQMLEWYRLGFTLEELADDLERFLVAVSAELAPTYSQSRSISALRRVTYRQLFEERFGINPHVEPVPGLSSLAAQMNLAHVKGTKSRADLLDALFTMGIAGELQEPVVVMDYPDCQAALAEITCTDDGDRVARRFELFASGVELANAYQELDDATLLKDRFTENNRLREKLAKPVVPADEELIAATGNIGVYAGIALGMDRFAMVLMGAGRLEDVSL